MPGKYLALLYELKDTPSELQYVLLQFLPAHNEMSQSPNERYCMNVCNIPLPQNFLLLPGYKEKKNPEKKQAGGKTLYKKGTHIQN